ncbi:hypothetical protein FPV67DRAFT_1510939 [Lyophyllum atratum]|nr:hypothetical protein FPV67DRAFT_1510939 [Lyophyllum atratum]
MRCQRRWDWAEGRKGRLGLRDTPAGASRISSLLWTPLMRNVLTPFARPTVHNDTLHSRPLRVTNAPLFSHLFSQRATIKPKSRELYVFCGLTRSQQGGEMTTLASGSPNDLFKCSQRPGNWAQVL